ncbi:cytochrome P450 [Mycobacterium sp. pUA109]|uniref:cytochrome P450 n=1 Tax=Mycobacterium sp. pUA109 TaxID=3238982 RepID=UPI00351B19B5
MAVRPPLHPPRWAPTFVRWQHTRIGWIGSWRLALRGLWAGYRHTIFDYATGLPGQDDIMVARAPLAKFVVVRNPDIARHILVANQDNYAKCAEYDLLAVAFGRGLVTDLDDELWQRNRRLVQPIFAKRQVDAFGPQMTAAAVAAAQRWEDHAAAGHPLDIAAEMNYITLDIIARTMFGIDLCYELAEQLRVDFARLLTLFGYGFIGAGSRPLRWWSNRRRSPRLAINALRRDATVVAPRTMRGLRRIERFLDGLIADYRSGKIDRTDNLLALLMAAQDPETGYRYSDMEIRDELMTFLGAGFETTAAALAWTWYLLSENHEARGRLGDELDQVLAGRDPGAEDVDQLPWTQAVVAEAMRRYPPIMGVGRVAKSDDVLGDYPIKAGTNVAILIHGVHHNQRCWADANSFDPARFLKESFDPQLRRAHIPFGAGKRMCIASGFATFEAILVIATLAQRFELDLVPGQRLRRELTFTGGPDGPLLMVPRARSLPRAVNFEP